MVQPLSFSPLQALAQKWRVFALLAAALTQLMRRHEGGKVQTAYQQAEQLEICVRAAQCALCREISGALEEGPPQTDDDDAALTFLFMVSACLLALAYVIDRVKSRMVSAPGWVLAR